MIALYCESYRHVAYRDAGPRRFFNQYASTISKTAVTTVSKSSSSEISEHASADTILTPPLPRAVYEGCLEDSLEGCTFWGIVDRKNCGKAYLLMQDLPFVSELG